MDKEISFKAYKYRLVEDNDGEVSLTFKVSQQEKMKAIEVPTNEILNIQIKRETG